MLRYFRMANNSMHRLKVYLTLLAFSLATLSQFAEINIFYLGQHFLSTYGSPSSSVEKKNKSSKPNLDFNATLQRETLTSKRNNNNNPKISFFIGSDSAFFSSFSEKFENTIASDDALGLIGYARLILSRSPPLII
jgi:hypothetical protein